MNLIVERADVWAAALEDQPGGLARVLKRLKEAGADLDFIIARRRSRSRGKAVAFVTPLRGDEQVAAAAEAGFNMADSIHSVRVQGQNRPGLAADIAETLAGANINLRGFSAAELGTRFVMYIDLDSEADAEKVVTVLQQQWQREDSHWKQDAA